MAFRDANSHLGQGFYQHRRQREDVVSLGWTRAHPDAPPCSDFIASQISSGDVVPGSGPLTPGPLGPARVPQAPALSTSRPLGAVPPRGSRPAEEEGPGPSCLCWPATRQPVPCPAPVPPPSEEARRLRLSIFRSRISAWTEDPPPLALAASPVPPAPPRHERAPAALSARAPPAAAAPGPAAPPPSALSRQQRRRRRLWRRGGPARAAAAAGRPSREQPRPGQPGAPGAGLDRQVNIRRSPPLRGRVAAAGERGRWVRPERAGLGEVLGDPRGCFGGLRLGSAWGELGGTTGRECVRPGPGAVRSRPRAGIARARASRGRGVCAASLARVPRSTCTAPAASDATAPGAAGQERGGAAEGGSGQEEGRPGRGPEGGGRDAARGSGGAA